MTYSSSAPAQGSGDNSFDINKFQQLLDRLEASKSRQQSSGGANASSALSLNS